VNCFSFEAGLDGAENCAAVAGAVAVFIGTGRGAWDPEPELIATRPAFPVARP